MDCSICYSHRLDDKLPDQVCGDPRCEAQYHQVCLYEVRITSRKKSRPENAQKISTKYFILHEITTKLSRLWIHKFEFTRDAPYVTHYGASVVRIRRPLYTLVCYNNTVKCCYNAVQLIIILHTALRWQQSNVNHTSNSQYLALTGELWGVYYEDFKENWPRYNGTSLYHAVICTLRHIQLYWTA